MAKSLKDRCYDVMVTHLKTKGFPNMTRKAILSECPAMWKALDKEGLTEELKALGYTFQKFCRTADDKCGEAAFYEASTWEHSEVRDECFKSCTELRDPDLGGVRRG